MAKREPPIVWNLNELSEKRRLIEQITKLPKGLYEVSIKPRRRTRTLRQNKYYFVAVVAPFAEWLRENYGDSGITADQAHEMLKVQILGWDERYSEAVGKTLKFIPRSHDLNTMEFWEYVEKASAWLAEFAEIIVLPPELFYESKENQEGTNRVTS